MHLLRGPPPSVIFRIGLLFQLLVSAALSSPPPSSLVQSLDINKQNASTPFAGLPQLNITDKSPLTANTNIQIPVPYTSLSLLFTYFGPAIPLPSFQSAFANANLLIISNVAAHSGVPIPDNRFDYDDVETGVHLSVIENRGIKDMTWLEPFQILQALRGFVVDVGHCRMLQWEIRMDLDEVVGIGLLWYHPPGKTEAAAAVS